jgi:hypothetical protein
VTVGADSSPPPHEGESLLERLDREVGPLPPNYVGPIGARMFCANCPTDQAFSRFSWAVEHICARSTWQWYIERLRLLECDLLEVERVGI